MSTSFVKMHGNGNDFVLLDRRDAGRPLDAGRVRAIADRRRGVGCDQLLVAERARDLEAALAMRIFNADGSEATQCGNGLRCFAVYARALGMVDSDRFEVETAGGRVSAEILAGGRVRTSLGVPALEPGEVPMRAERRATRYPLRLDGASVEVGAVSVGNPHVVITVDSVDQAAVRRIGPAVQALAVFPQGVNVGFMQPLGRDRIRLRVYERGAGETLACGSGACAAVVVGRVQGLLDARVGVSLPGGELDVEWAGEGHPVIMTGPTEWVFRGEMGL